MQLPEKYKENLKFSLKNIRRISNVQGEFQILLIFFRENLKFSLYFSGRISNSPYIFQGEFFRENFKFSLYFSGSCIITNESLLFFFPVLMRLVGSALCGTVFVSIFSQINTFYTFDHTPPFPFFLVLLATVDFCSTIPFISSITFMFGRRKK